MSAAGFPSQNGNPGLEIDIRHPVRSTHTSRGLADVFGTRVLKNSQNPRPGPRALGAMHTWEGGFFGKNRVLLTFVKNPELRARCNPEALCTPVNRDAGFRMFVNYTWLLYRGCTEQSQKAESTESDLYQRAVI